jgi:D-proline reductase (dithiol) PrdB
LKSNKSVDSFKFLPRLIAAYYQGLELPIRRPIPWAPLPGPIEECKFALVTSGGIYHRELNVPFDVEREREEPTWGDPSYREIPMNTRQEQVAISHLHISPGSVLEDVNVLLPIHRFGELVEQGRIGGLAEIAYSFMGYQGTPPNTTGWERKYGPEVAMKMKAEGVNCVLLTPA